MLGEQLSMFDSPTLQPSVAIQRFAEKAGFPLWLYEGTRFPPGVPLPEYIDVETALVMIGNAARNGDLTVTMPYSIASFRFTTLSALIIAFEHAPTLGDALTLLEDVGGARNGHFWFSTVRADGVSALRLKPMRPFGDAALLLNEPTVYNYAELIRTSRLGAAEGMVASLEHGPHSLTPQIWPDAETVRYEQAWTGIAFPTSWETEANPRFDPDLWAMARARCISAANSISRGELLFVLRSDMERKLKETGALPSLAEIAAERAVSTRTLVRHLKAAGTSYQKLADDMQKARALELLGRPGARVHEVADQLGFSDSSSFARTFRRWFGNAPSDYVATAPEQAAQEPASKGVTTHRSPLA